MLERYTGLLMLVLLVITVTYFKPVETTIFAQDNQTYPIFLQPIKTESRFKEELGSVTESIHKKTIYQDDPELETGEERTVSDGKDGIKTSIVKITYYDGKQYSKEVLSTEVTPPKDKTILRGTKIVWRNLDTTDGQIRYWKKLRVWATHYDSTCLGCDQWTAIGMRAGFGVIAVDPKVIPLKSKVYVPEYGMAIAGDTGGAIKGNIIDLGFDDARTSGWKARFVDIYLL